MKLIINILPLFLTFFIYSQVDTIKINNFIYKIREQQNDKYFIKFFNNITHKEYSQGYFSLKNDTIKDGEFKELYYDKLTDNQKIRSIKFYKNNKLDGTQKTFYYNLDILKKEEIYKEGKLIKETLFNKNSEIVENLPVDVQAKYKGNWNNYLTKEMKKIMKILNKIPNTKSDIIIIRFIIDEKGNIDDVFLVKPYHPEIDNLLINSIKKSSGKWIPAEIEGEKVKAYRTQPIKLISE